MEKLANIVSVSYTHRLAIATSVAEPEIQSDDQYLVTSLRGFGVETIPCVWNDPAVDWSKFDAVLIRSIWDYFKHYASFKHWLGQLPVPTINNKELLLWNSDKRYLIELVKYGVQIIPTQVVSASQLQRTLAAMPGREVVIKPTISGTAWHTVRGVAGETEFDQMVAQLPLELDYRCSPTCQKLLAMGNGRYYFSTENTVMRSSSGPRLATIVYRAIMAAWPWRPNPMQVCLPARDVSWRLRRRSVMPT